MSTRAARSGKKPKQLKTFTYFIPAPPHRKNGYREIEFDKIMAGILQSGFELIELKTEGVEAGVFVIALISPTNKKAAALDLNLDIQTHFKLQETHSSPDIVLEEDDQDA